jgi:hypothetical protein
MRTFTTTEIDLTGWFPDGFPKVSVAGEHVNVRLSESTEIVGDYGSVREALLHVLDTMAKVRHARERGVA